VEKVMEKETIGNLLIGGSVTAVITYILHVFTKRSDRYDKLEERIAALEIGHRDIDHIKATQAELKIKIDTILETLTDLRIQLGNTRRSRRGEDNGEERSV
jgi:hypothetical protein